MYQFNMSACEDLAGAKSSLLDASAYEHLAGAEPPVYASQLKPRGRKPKAKVAESVSREIPSANGDGLQSASSKKRKTGKGKKTKTRKAAKGKKGKVGNKKCKKNKKAKKGKKCSKSGMSGMEPVDLEATGKKAAADASEPTEMKSKRKPRRRAASKGKPCESSLHPEYVESVEPEVVETAAKSRKGRKTAEQKGVKINKRKQKANTIDEVAVPPIAEPPLGDAPLPVGFARPPNWVNAGNVYSNMYRRAQSGGHAKADVQRMAKEATKLFREQGIVAEGLMTSFRGKGKRAQPDASDPAGVQPPQDQPGGNANEFDGWYINERPEYQEALREAGA